MTDIATLPVKSRRHRWNIDAIIRKPACETHDGNDRTERTCLACGMVRITVHPPKGFPWHEWRHANGKVFVCDSTPPCCAREASSDPDILPPSRPANESDASTQGQPRPLSTSSTSGAASA